MMFVDARRLVLWVPLRVIAMSTANTSVAAYTEVTAYTEHPARGAESETVPIPQELWIVLILSFILLVLLAWRAIAEAGAGPGGPDNGGNWLPPL